MSRTTKMKKPTNSSAGKTEQYPKNGATFTADMRFIFTRNMERSTWVEEDDFDETATIPENRFYPPIYN